MKTYSSSGFRNVKAASLSEAAGIFATRQARREFGRTGYARTCSLSSYSQDGTLAEFSAFIGYSIKGQPHTTTGHNFNFTVIHQETLAEQLARHTEEAARESFEEARRVIAAATI